MTFLSCSRARSFCRFTQEAFVINEINFANKKHELNLAAVNGEFAKGFPKITEKSATDKCEN